MTDMMYQIYLWCIPVAALLAFAGSAQLRPFKVVDADLFKCFSAIMGQTLSIFLWYLFIRSDSAIGQPWLFLCITLSVTTYIVTSRPAGLMSGVVGGILVFGIAASGICGVVQLLYGFSPVVDWINWFCIFLMGCLNLIALMGWGSGNIGRRYISSRPWLFNRSRSRGAEG